MPDRNIQRSVSNAFLERNNDYTGIKEEGNFNYKFHNKPRAFNAHIESISTLTNNYERIKVQLSQ